MTKSQFCYRNIISKKPSDNEQNAAVPLVTSDRLNISFTAVPFCITIDTNDTFLKLRR